VEIDIEWRRSQEQRRGEKNDQKYLRCAWGVRKALETDMNVWNRDRKGKGRHKKYKNLHLRCARGIREALEIDIK